MDHNQIKQQLEALNGLDVVQRAIELVKIAQLYLDSCDASLLPATYNKEHKDDKPIREQ
jgi:hypothetical protein